MAFAVTETGPKAPPVTVGCVGGVIDPAGMVTLEGEKVTVPGPLVVVRVTVTGAVAGAPMLIGKGRLCPGPTTRFFGIVMVSADESTVIVVAGLA